MRGAIIRDIAKARILFKKAGLAFPVLPRKLALSIKEQGPWLYSTRSIDMSPYNLDEYVEKACKGQTDDYALLSHSGHGVNSYAIQYYLVCRPLRMFLFLGWGGVYMDNKKEAEKIRECFSLADRITKAAKKLRLDSQLTVVVSDFYGSYWSPNWEIGLLRHHIYKKTPQQVLSEALDWIAGQQ